MPGGLATQQIRPHAVRNNGSSIAGGGGGGGGGGSVGFTCSQFYGTGPSTIFHNLFKMSYININVDETDNNTAANTNNNNNNSNNNNNNNDLLQLGNLKPRYIMDDIFHREEERLKTFINWPLDWLNKNELAMTGMFYMGEDDKCKCYFCEVEIGRWEHGDEPVSEHLRWSPNCPLLKRRTTNNVPLNAEALDSILPAPSYDICGLNDTIEVRPQAIVDEVRSNLQSASNSANGGVDNIVTHFYPDYPEYAIETARLRSYAEWPRHMKQKPKELAEAGFFYTGMGDRVKCFSCGGGLKDWDENDDPWEEHAMWMSKCRYLKLMKGQSFIDAVLAKHKSKEMEKQAKSNAEEEKDTLQQSVAAAAAAAATSNSSATAVAESDITRKLTNCSIPEEKVCKICYNAEYNTAFLPCGHVVACAKCASSVTKCPVCRKPFTDVMRVYFS